MVTRRDFLSASVGIVAGTAIGNPIRGAVAARNGTETFESLPYDSEVEYIESTGTQYIDTGVIAKSPCAISCDFVWTALSDNALLIGAANTSALSTKALYAIGQYPRGKWFIRFGNVYSSVSNTGDIRSGEMNSVIVVLEKNNVSRIIGGQTSVSLIGQAEQNVGLPFFLFAINRNGVDSFHSSARVYGLQMFSNGVLVRDMIPVRVTNDLGGVEGAMYDRVTGELFRNAGSGSFIVGPDV